MTTLPRNYTSTQAAALIGCCSKTLRNLEKNGMSPTFILIGARRVYPAAELEAWLAQNTFGGR